jgi:hypothetical protein
VQDERPFREVLRPRKHDDHRVGFARYREKIKSLVMEQDEQLLMKAIHFECPIIQLHGSLVFDLHSNQYFSVHDQHPKYCFSTSEYSKFE